MSFFDEKIYERPVFTQENSMAELSGEDCFGEPVCRIPLSDMHTMLIGAPGMGKTVQIRKMISQTTRITDSTHIIFDPKGEYCREFYRSGCDYALSLFDIPDIRCEKWSLMAELADDPHPETTISEIAGAIFKDAVDKNTSNPFFPQSAESLVTAIWTMIYRRYRQTGLPGNYDLIMKTRGVTREQLINEANRTDENGRRLNAELLPLIERILDPRGGTATANVRQEAETVLARTFRSRSNFCADGSFSVRNFIRSGKGRRLFLVYDFAAAESSKQIFGLLINLMMKESLTVSAQTSTGRTYYYLDELPVLPDNLTYLSSLSNFGRSAGSRVIIGLQSLSQLFDTFGENKGSAMLAAFTNSIIMGVNDPTTVEKLAARSGRITEPKTRMGLTRDSVETHSAAAYRIPENIIAGLGVGEAIISVRGTEPFYVKLDM